MVFAIAPSIIRAKTENIKSKNIGKSKLRKSISANFSKYNTVSIKPSQSNIKLSQTPQCVTKEVEIVKINPLFCPPVIFKGASNNISKDLNEKANEALQNVVKSCKGVIEYFEINSYYFGKPMHEYEKTITVILSYSSGNNLLTHAIDFIPETCIDPLKDNSFQVIKMLFGIDNENADLPNINKFLWNHNFVETYQGKIKDTVLELV
jgi:hypothetical protein